MRPIRALLALSLLPLAALAQEAVAVSYKVDYVIKDGAQPRRYAVLIEKGGRGSFRVGTRVPYLTGPNNYSYADVGVNIDARLNDTPRGLALDSNIDISSLLGDPKAASAPGTLPVIAQVRTNVTHSITVGKPTVIAVIDDPVTLKKFEIEATLAVSK